MLNEALVDLETIDGQAWRLKLDFQNAAFTFISVTRLRLSALYEIFDWHCSIYELKYRLIAKYNYYKLDIDILLITFKKTRLTSIEYFYSRL